MSIILTQTDTTVGFLSQNTQKLFEIKLREPSKPFIKVFSDLKSFSHSGLRVPNRHKSSLRRAKKTSFITKDTAFRISKNILHSQVLRDLKWNYSTSANESGKRFNMEFCEQKADIIIQNRDGLSENTSSSLYKLTKHKKRRLR